MPAFFRRAFGPTVWKSVAKWARTHSSMVQESNTSTYTHTHSGQTIYRKNYEALQQKLSWAQQQKNRQTAEENRVGKKYSRYLFFCFFFVRFVRWETWKLLLVQQKLCDFVGAFTAETTTSRFYLFPDFDIIFQYKCSRLTYNTVLCMADKLAYGTQRL